MSSRCLQRKVRGAGREARSRLNRRLPPRNEGKQQHDRVGEKVLSLRTTRRIVGEVGGMGLCSGQQRQQGAKSSRGPPDNGTSEPIDFRAELIVRTGLDDRTVTGPSITD